jgi:hypothetical protein
VRLGVGNCDQRRDLLGLQLAKPASASTRVRQADRVFHRVAIVSWPGCVLAAMNRASMPQTAARSKRRHEKTPPA